MALSGAVGAPTATFELPEFSALAIFSGLAALASAAPAALADPEIDDAGLNQASNLAQHKNYHAAYHRFRLMAEKGCPYSQCALGIMHQKGIGAKKNARQAAYWYEKSARQGHPDAAHRLALMHLTDEGIKRDVEKGAEWLEKAAQQGVVEAKYELGKLDITERSEKALAEGRAWLQEAASQGFKKAEELIAQVPDIPTAPSNGKTTTVEKGLVGLQHSWTGYADLAKTLDSISAQASK